MHKWSPVDKYHKPACGPSGSGTHQRAIFNFKEPPMETALPARISGMLKPENYMPSISIVMPFDPKMTAKNEIAQALNTAAEEAIGQVQRYYPDDMGILAIQKLRMVLQNLNWSTHKKSVAIYVSPVFEKVLYLDISVEAKVIVDGSFEIRDLVFCKKQVHKYLVLVLTNEESRIFLGNSESFVRIVSTAPAKHRPEHSDGAMVNHHQAVEMFLQQVDHSLGIILQAYHLPMFVLGSERIIGQFSKLTSHGSSIIGNISGQFSGASPERLLHILQPYVADWKKVIDTDIMNHLQDADDRKRLSAGIGNVWKDVTHHRGSLLVVEKNYMYAADDLSDSAAITKGQLSFSQFSCIRDAVDDIIEKVLINGGDVEFVDEGMLRPYEKIALIHKY